jgi:hypothetical protein
MRETFCYDIGLIDRICTKPYIFLIASWIKSDIILHIDNTLSSSICQAQKIVSVNLALTGAKVTLSRQNTLR